MGSRLVSSGRSRRSLAVVAGVSVTAALALVPAPGAQAAVTGLYAAGSLAGADFQGSGGGTCDLTSAPGSDEVLSTVQHFTHGTRHASATGKATFTNSLDSSDQVTVKTHVASTITLKRKHRDLRVFDLTAGGSITVDHTVLGSHCHGSGEAVGETEVVFTEHKKGWFTLTRDTGKPHSIVEFVLINAVTGQEVALDFWQGDVSHAVSRVKLKPGTYEISQCVIGVSSPGVGILAKSQSRSSKVAQTVHLHAAFTPLKKHR